MSVVYTADIFCDGPDCSTWTHGCTSDTVPTKDHARNAAGDDFVRYKSKDYCRDCWKKINGTKR